MEENMNNIPVQAQILKKTFENAFEDIRKKYNLTMNEIILLLYLERNKMKNTARDMVEEIMITKSHISKSVDSLVDKKIITRLQDKDDRKVIHLQITENASKLVKELKKIDESITKKVTKGISKEELAILEKALQKIKENISDIIKNL